MWCQLLCQAEHTLNLLHPSRIMPTMSAYAHLWGQHDYNVHPYAPLGCRVEAYLFLTICKTWAPHSATGYYIGNSHKHYRCHEVYISNTRSNCVCNTVFFKHKYLTMPTINPNVVLILAADKPSDAISGITPKSSITKDAILQLMAIFRTQSFATSDTTLAQRVLREIAATQSQQAESEPTPPQRVEDPEAWMELINKSVNNKLMDALATTTTSPDDNRIFAIDFPTSAPLSTP
jgi:hypothetical protein